MPGTPEDDARMISPPPEFSPYSVSRPSCPPEEGRPYGGGGETGNDDQNDLVAERTYTAPTQQPTPPADDNASPDVSTTQTPQNKSTEVEGEDGMLRDTPSPVSAVEEASDSDQRLAQSAVAAAAPSIYSSTLLGSPFSRTRFLPNSTSSFLRPGSMFKGTQQSDRQVYEVQVEIKYVDMNESFLCGYLRIKGLTDDHPTLTTYFEGEIIGTKYTFQTRHDEWGSNDRVDMQHWARFPAWRPLSKQAKRSDFSYRNFAQRENIFMRWKEHFLVPDHRVRTISGASFEGFYYICFNQVSGHISGIYFHAKSEKSVGKSWFYEYLLTQLRFQQLELDHVEDHGCTGAIEFR